MKLNKKILLQQLANNVQQNINDISRLKNKSIEELTTSPVNGGWSIVQIIEHLNTYNAFYLPIIEKAMNNAVANKSSNTFSTGILGNYFVKMMQPQDGIIMKKYKAANRHVPHNAIDSKGVFDTYLTDQQHLLQLLDMAYGYNINAIKIPTSITNLIKLKLGDVFRFLTAHQQRHFVQIDGLLKTKQLQPV